ncbi:ArsR family transcriptional regulator [Pyrodictium occultum]|nr:ArsR family transcriptional regulator [Pyrodictium occultum]
MGRVGARLQPVAVALAAALAAAAAAPALAGQGAVFLASDRGDLLFLEELGAGFTPAKCVLPDTVPGYVYVLDYNAPSCGGWPRGLGERLLELAEKGATVVLGYNTLRAISVYEPGVLARVGLVAKDEGSGVHAIHASLGLQLHGAPASIVYKTWKYRRFRVLPQAGWRVLARFSDGDPAIVAMHYGRGRLVLLFFNPVWPTIDGEKGFTRLVRALHSYLAGGLGTALAAAAVAAALSAAAAQSSSSSSRGERMLRHLMRPWAAVAVLAHRIRGADAAKHPVRAKILELAERRGYVTLGMVVRELGLKRTPALWHLTLLVDAGLLETRRVLNTQIYYRRGRAVEAVLAFLLEAEPRRRIAEALLQSPASISQLARALGMSKSTVKHHIDVLRVHNVVEEAGYGYRLSDWALRLVPRLLARGGEAYA